MYLIGGKLHFANVGVVQIANATHAGDCTVRVRFPLVMRLANPFAMKKAYIFSERRRGKMTSTKCACTRKFAQNSERGDGDCQINFVAKKRRTGGSGSASSSLSSMTACRTGPLLLELFGGYNSHAPCLVLPLQPKIADDSPLVHDKVSENTHQMLGLHCYVVPLYLGRTFPLADVTSNFQNIVSPPYRLRKHCPAARLCVSC